MGEIKSFEKVALVVGVLSTLESDDKAIEELTKLYGPIVKQTAPRPFDYTDYYDKEMGGKPRRYILMFKNLVNPEDLSKIKIQTNLIEEQFLKNGGRNINLDPGILSLSNFILATTKNSAHRIPLLDGIYAEITLFYHTHSFHSLSWTYEDYKSEEFISLFNQLRFDLKLMYKELRRCS